MMDQSHSLKCMKVVNVNMQWTEVEDDSLWRRLRRTLRRKQPKEEDQRE